MTTRVLVVTHAYEKTQVSHTGHLLPSLLPRAEQLWWARRHVAPDLNHLMAPGARAALLFPDPEARCLLPEGHGEGRAGVGARMDAGADAGGAPGALTLVVPDGTWRQARRLAHRNPVLAALPRVTLPDLGPARWTVRRSARPGGLCTLEAVARALGVLHGEAARALVEEVLVAHDRAIWAARGLAPPLPP